MALTIGTKIATSAAVVFLALSLASGVAAEPVTVTLQENPTGTCTPAVVETSGADFGTYTWNGSEYVADEGSGVAVLTVVVSQNIGPSKRCNVSIQGTDLVANGESISVDHISVRRGNQGAGGGSAPPQTLTTTSASLWGNVVGEQEIGLTLAQPGNTLPDGTYSGTITFTATSGS